MAIADQRPLVDEWRVPRDLRLRGRDLVWSNRNGFDTAPLSDPQTLSAFVKLADAKPQAIEKFARRWGVLEVCQHLLPASHNPPQPDWGEPHGCQLVQSQGPGGPFIVEPISAWQSLARVFDAALTISDAIVVAKKPGPEDAWRELLQPPIVQSGTDAASLFDTFDEPRVSKSSVLLRQNRQRLAWFIRRLLEWGQVRAIFDWTPNATLPTFELVPGSLFAALAVELATAIARTTRVVRCSACGDLFDPERKPRANQRRYCPKCRRLKKPQRDAERDWRERARRKRKRKVHS